MEPEHISLEYVIPQAGHSLFKLVLAVASRAQEIAAGGQMLTEGCNRDKPVSAALAELKAKAIRIEKK